MAGLTAQAHTAAAHDTTMWAAQAARSPCAVGGGRYLHGEGEGVEEEGEECKNAVRVDKSLGSDQQVSVTQWVGNSEREWQNVNTKHT